MQALWNSIATILSRRTPTRRGRQGEALEAALAKVGFQHCCLRPRTASLSHGAAWALTLNGIAQGYVTDRVVALLRAGGIERSLVDMGESRALGTHPDGRPWQVGDSRPGRAGAHRRDVGRSSIRPSRRPAATAFASTRPGRFNHLFDPARVARPTLQKRHRRDADRHCGGCPLDGVQPHAGRPDQNGLENPGKRSCNNPDDWRAAFHFSMTGGVVGVGGAVEPPDKKFELPQSRAPPVLPFKGDRTRRGRCFRHL